MNRTKSATRSTTLQAVLCGAIRLYQVALSPILSRGCCRFEPSCSAYMLEAIKTHGIAKGCLWGLKRLCRCHPFASRAGYDPVPCCEPHPKASQTPLHRTPQKPPLKSHKKKPNKPHKETDEN